MDYNIFKILNVDLREAERRIDYIDEKVEEHYGSNYRTIIYTHYNPIVVCLYMTVDSVDNGKVFSYNNLSIRNDVPSLPDSDFEPGGFFYELVMS